MENVEGWRKIRTAEPNLPINLSFGLSELDKKRELVNSVFQNLKLDGKKNAHGDP
ncbi:MAG: hypothetical protein JSR80_07990 [Verrucomicrobia bacterium]|nr:hypothetical protein [Verrucomicrobiota bacterium]